MPVKRGKMNAIEKQRIKQQNEKKEKEAEDKRRQHRQFQAVIDLKMAHEINRELFSGAALGDTCKIYDMMPHHGMDEDDKLDFLTDLKKTSDITKELGAATTDLGDILEVYNRVFAETAEDEEEEDEEDENDDNKDDDEDESDED